MQLCRPEKGRHMYRFIFHKPEFFFKLEPYFRQGAHEQRAFPPKISCQVTGTKQDDACVCVCVCVLRESTRVRLGANGCVGISKLDRVCVSAGAGGRNLSQPTLLYMGAGWQRRGVATAKIMSPKAQFFPTSRNK